MTLTTTSLSATDSTSLHCRCWAPAGEAGGGVAAVRGVLAFCHGIGEHGGRYQHVAEALSTIAVAVVIVDLRGHGKSAGRRGHVSAYRAFLDDYVAAITLARERFPDAALFCGGHSLGGLIALGAVVEGLIPNECAGMAVSAPALAVGFEPPAWKVAAARLLSRLAPGALFATGLEADYLSHDPEVVRAYREDPLVHGKISARAYIEVLRLQEITRSGAPGFSLPLLMLQGTDDHDVSPAATRAFFDAASSSDKGYREYDGFYHEVLNENDRESAISDVLRWLEVRLN